MMLFTLTAAREQSKQIFSGEASGYRLESQEQWEPEELYFILYPPHEKYLAPSFASGQSQEAIA